MKMIANNAANTKIPVSSSHLLASLTNMIANSTAHASNNLLTY